MTTAPPEIARLQAIRTFPELIAYLRDVLDWPIDEDTAEDEAFFEYDAAEVGLDEASAVKIERIRRLRPLVSGQSWGIFFIEFKPGKLPITVLRRILRALVVKKRAGNDKQRWEMGDLLFISILGEQENRKINLAHFSDDGSGDGRAALRVVDWDEDDAHFHMLRTIDELHCLRWPDDGADHKEWRETWAAAFRLKPGEVARTSAQLAVQMADLARLIRSRVNGAMAIESSGGPLNRMYRALKEVLVSDLTPDGFADMYAQTITYGLFAARRSRPMGVTAETARDMVPNTNPFLRDLLAEFTDVSGASKSLDFDELGIDALVEVLNQADMEAIVADFDDKNPAEDPVIHFYEDFLHEYDSKLKAQRGIFFTPRPVVSFIVRSVDELLRSEFGLEDGLADTTTWGEMKELQRDLNIPEGTDPDTPFVQILDPAVGTGTFLVEVIDVIWKTMRDKWQRQGKLQLEFPALWNEYVPKHLLPRLYGYELMMAPYAIAHMKIGLKLSATGYRFGDDERLRVYLTNALEPPQDFSGRFEFAIPALAHEAEAVNDVKRHQRYTVVIGNPPYSVRSANLSDEARKLIEQFKFVDGERIVEKGALQLEKNLNDDYVKFFGLILTSLLAHSVGVAGMITNHAFLDNPTLRGFRWNLITHFDRIRILDLHGNSKKREQVPEGKSNENVFDIQQGVAITLMLRSPSVSRDSSVGVAESWGSREEKYSALGLGSFEYTKVDCPPPWFRFADEDSVITAEFGSFASLPEMMPLNSTGIKTHRDAFVLDFDEAPLRQRVAQFRGDVSDDEIIGKYGLSDTYGWRLKEARRRIRARSDWDSAFQLCMYRPLDIRHIYYHADLVELPRIECMQHLSGGRNIAILATRQVTSPPFNHVFVTRLVNEMKTCSHDRGTNCFPLYLRQDNSGLRLGEGKRPNLSADFIRRLGSSLELGRNADGIPEGLSVDDILNYAYAVFHSPCYRHRYMACLQTEFPRLPFPGNLGLFRNLAGLGGELVALHLMESPKLDDIMAHYAGRKDPEVERVGWSDETVWIDAAKTSASSGHRATKPGTMGFHGVPEEVWDFRIGGYQVCHKWLKDRKGRALSDEDIAHYQKIVVALSETIRIMGEVDEVIEKHGGWPGAFAAGDSES